VAIIYTRRKQMRLTTQRKPETVKMNATALWGWQIKYAGDARPSIRVSGDFAKAEAIAKKRNKYQECFEITPAPKQDRTIEMEQAAEEARKYA
jgi:hypothetical protein